MDQGELELKKAQLNLEKMQLKLESRRSMVRVIVTVMAMLTLCIILGYGVMWMGERSALIGTISLFGPLIGYWFGERKGEKVYEQLTKAIEKLTKS